VAPGGHGSGEEESTLTGFFVFFRIRAQSFLKNRIRNQSHFLFSAIAGVYVDSKNVIS